MFKSHRFSSTLKSRRLHFSILFLFLFWVSGAAPLIAGQTFPEQARNVVQGWLALNSSPLGVDLSARTVGRTETFYQDGDPLYYVVHLREDGEKRGFVLVPAEDRIEPIIAFFPEAAEYDPSSENPAGALVQKDLRARMQRALAQPEYNRETSRESDQLSTHSRKWDYLESIDPRLRYYNGEDSITDVRIAPLVDSRWSQGDADEGLCYNYYTPENYVCGCVATAMAQLMRYHAHPTDGVGTPSFTIEITYVEEDDTEYTESESRSLRGGDGAGGAYNWADMVHIPSAGVTTAQRQAIGALTHDAGVSVRMSYASGGSGAWMGYADMEFVDTFGYSNSIYSSDFESGFDDPSLNRIINPNLDASYPVLIGVDAEGGGGHAIVCDGYGYELSAMYHHLNMGWGGNDDAWYNLPDIETQWYTFYAVSDAVYNVFASGSGEIISGRVTDEAGNPISGAVVAATRGAGGSYSDTSDANGIYALAGIPSDSSYTISVSKSGYTFDSTTSSTGTSGSSSIGNVWGVDFTGSEESEPSPSGSMPSLAPIYELLLD